MGQTYKKLCFALALHDKSTRRRRLTFRSASTNFVVPRVQVYDSLISSTNGAILNDIAYITFN